MPQNVQYFESTSAEQDLPQIAQSFELPAPRLRRWMGAVSKDLEGPGNPKVGELTILYHMIIARVYTVYKVYRLDYLLQH